ncbi:MAG: hypothetical protein II427_02200, partial [Firmicutes bacterium]|nr:hypothetical protein [Bacillota bacterium]
ANIKYENRDDMALIYSDTICKAAGTFTRKQNNVDVVLVLFSNGLFRDHLVEQRAGHGAHAPQDAEIFFHKVLFSVQKVLRVTLII